MCIVYYYIYRKFSKVLKNFFGIFAFFYLVIYSIFLNQLLLTNLYFTAYFSDGSTTIQKSITIPSTNFKNIIFEGSSSFSEKDAEIECDLKILIWLYEKDVIKEASVEFHKKRKVIIFYKSFFIFKSKSF